MIPKSVSATALKAAKNCMAMYKAHHIDYARGLDNDAAILGTTIHAALELLVTQVYVQKSHAYDPSMAYDYFDLYFMKNFGKSGDDQNELWVAGREMIKTWLERTSFEGKTVISTEQKLFIMVPTSAGEFKLNYIIDRLDQNGPLSFEVIDYKSSIFNIKSGDLWDDLQAGIYALSVFIAHPDATEVKVTFDMLRYAQSSTFFTKDKCRQVYLDIKTILEEIIAESEDKPTEKLNPACGFCVRKTSCPTLQKNREAGGVFSLDLNSQIDLRTQVELQMGGLSALRKELDRVIEVTLGQAGQLELSTALSTAKFTTSRERSISSVEMVREIVGQEIFERYGKLDIGLGQFDLMLKNEDLTEDQRERLGNLVKKGWKSPTLKFTNNRGPEATSALSPAFENKLQPAAPRKPILGLE